MMPGFVEVDSVTFYVDIWPRIKNDVEIIESNRGNIESNRGNAKKGVRTVIIKWGYKDHAKEKIILAISQLSGAREKHWVVPTLIQRV